MNGIGAQSWRGQPFRVRSAAWGPPGEKATTSRMAAADQSAGYILDTDARDLIINGLPTEQH